MKTRLQAIGVCWAHSCKRNATGVAPEIEADINVKASAYHQMPSFVWVTPERVFGGNLGFSVITPTAIKVLPCHQVSSRSVMMTGLTTPDNGMSETLTWR